MNITGARVGVSRLYDVQERRLLTLIELLIVMSLLVMITGAISIGVVGAIGTERFRTDVRELVSKLQLAQDIMLITNSSVTVLLSEMGGKGLAVSIDTTGTITSAIARAVGDEKTLAALTSFTFTDAEGVRQSSGVQLNFHSKGFQMARGKIDISDGSRSDEIYLSGYPRRIVSGEAGKVDLAALESSAGNSSNFYPKEITEKLEEIKKQEEAKPQKSDKKSKMKNANGS